MLADNLDPEGTPNARNTLFLYGQITSGLPLSLLLDPSFSPTEITFQVGVGADKASNDIPQTQLSPKTCGRSSRASRSGFP